MHYKKSRRRGRKYSGKKIKGGRRALKRYTVSRGGIRL